MFKTGSNVSKPGVAVADGLAEWPLACVGTVRSEWCQHAVTEVTITIDERKAQKL